MKPGTALINQFKWVSIVTVAIIILIMWKQGCGNQKSEEKEKQLKVLYDSAVNQGKIKDRIIFEKQFQNEQSLNRADSLQDLLESTRINLRKLLSTNNRLASKINTARVLHDTVGYQEACDSLELTQKSTEERAEFYMNYSRQLKETLDSTLGRDNDIIAALNEEIELLKAAMNYAVKEVIPSVSRRFELYAGPSVIGNPKTLFNGYGGGIGLLTKKGQFWQADVLIINGETHYQVGTKLRLSFRNH